MPFKYEPCMTYDCLIIHDVYIPMMRVVFLNVCQCTHAQIKTN